MSQELPPVRCVTCGKVLGNLWNEYQNKIQSGISIEQALDEVGLRRYCCRLRLRNPFKVVDRKVQTQEDVDRMFENNFDNLSISYSSRTPTTGALSAMTDTTDMMIIPEEDEEEDIELPDIPTLEPKASGSSKVFRAW